jgi:murein DD-endopeptidase MepM/ murein hydrolase activator NlpD
LLGLVLTGFGRLLTGFFRYLFKSPLYQILAKIYYLNFRLKKAGTIKESPTELFHTKYLYLFIFLLSGIIIFANFIDSSGANARENKISKTVLANLVPTEFGEVSTEELIEETITPNSLITAGKEKYLAEASCSLEKKPNLINEEDLEENTGPFFSEEGDLVFKPNLMTGGGGEAVVSERQEIIYYTVQNGDTVSTIAQRFGISVNTILWANNLSAFSLIRPGNQLTILPYSGVLYTVKKGDTLAKIAKTYNIEVEKILSCNNLGNSLGVGQKIILPGAKKITASSVASRSSTYTGLSVIKDLIKSPSSKNSGNKMTWPTVGHRMTQYFSWRHPGVDIANKTGTPLYAADAGTVEFAGWARGYGNSIVINHGGGKKTRYGHASKLFVKAGDIVEKGENIAAMGSTGWSTGPHLHFEVIINGKKYNPLNYIK